MKNITEFINEQIIFEGTGAVIMIKCNRDCKGIKVLRNFGTSIHGSTDLGEYPVRQDDYVAVRCNYDGSIDYLGRSLYDNFSIAPEEVLKAIFADGEVRSINGDKVEHFPRNNNFGCQVKQTTIKEFLKKLPQEGFTYIYTDEYSDEPGVYKWYVKTSRKFVDLEDEFEK